MKPSNQKQNVCNADPIRHLFANLRFAILFGIKRSAPATNPAGKPQPAKETKTAGAVFAEPKPPSFKGLKSANGRKLQPIMPKTTKGKTWKP